MKAFYHNNTVAFEMFASQEARSKGDEMEVVEVMTGYYRVSYAGETIFRVSQKVVPQKYANAGQKYFQVEIDEMGARQSIGKRPTLVEALRYGFEFSFYPETVAAKMKANNPEISVLAAMIQSIASFDPSTLKRHQVSDRLTAVINALV